MFWWRKGRDYKHSLTAFCVSTLNQTNLFNVFPLCLALTTQIVSNCGVCTYKNTYLLRALLKVSLQCWLVTHTSFSGVLPLLCSLQRIIYMSSCLVALLKLLLSGQMCLPGYSLLLLRGWSLALEWTWLCSTDWCGCLCWILYQDKLLSWTNNHECRFGEYCLQLHITLLPQTQINGHYYMCSFLVLGDQYWRRIDHQRNQK